MKGLPLLKHSKEGVKVFAICRLVELIQQSELEANWMVGLEGVIIARSSDTAITHCFEV